MFCAVNLLKYSLMFLQVAEALLCYCMRDLEARAAAELAGLHILPTVDDRMVSFQQAANGVRPVFIATVEQHRHLPTYQDFMVLKYPVCFCPMCQCNLRHHLTCIVGLVLQLQRGAEGEARLAIW